MNIHLKEREERQVKHLKAWRDEVAKFDDEGRKQHGHMCHHLKRTGYLLEQSFSLADTDTLESESQIPEAPSAAAK